MRHFGLGDELLVRVRICFDVGSRRVAGLDLPHSVPRLVRHYSGCAPDLASPEVEVYQVVPVIPCGCN